MFYISPCFFVEMVGENMEQFIRIYESEPCFWQTKCKGYHNKNKRDAIYALIVDRDKKYHERDITERKESINEDRIAKCRCLRPKVVKELVEKVMQLQANNLQLRNVVAKLKGSNKSCKTRKQPRKFDFEKCPKQHILLKMLYLGWDYQGFACQEDSPETIEHHLMKALLTCQLIQSRDTSNYHRCGRTDKGVSSFDQVISITVRAAEEDKPPLEYCKMLNRLLPENIMAIGWSPVSTDFSARFNCNKRMYRYFFPRSNLDIEKMNEAAKLLIGVHDFRNLCKMDVGNGVTNFIRNIECASVSLIGGESNNFNGYEMCQLELVGKAFLWHQVRCIMAVLLLVGQGLEKPCIISRLLDIAENPRKPQYPLSHPIGLNLYKCFYDDCLNWNIDPTVLSSIVGNLQRLWAQFKIRTTHIESMLADLEKHLPKQVFCQSSGLVRKESKLYKELLTRHKCNSLEDRIEHYEKKRKLH